VIVVSKEANIAFIQAVQLLELYGKTVRKLGEATVLAVVDVT
jgi:hypothetical protein